jgi:hypothetical protein
MGRLRVPSIPALGEVWGEVGLKGQVTSRYEILPQGLRHSMGAIAYAKFDLDLLQMAADVSSPIPSAFAASRCWAPVEIKRKTAISRAVKPRLLCSREIRVGQLLQV